jgi:hypothetical protein
MIFSSAQLISTSYYISIPRFFTRVSIFPRGCKNAAAMRLTFYDFCGQP